MVWLLEGHWIGLRLHLLLHLLLLLPENLSLRGHHLLMLELRLPLRVLWHVLLHLLRYHGRGLLGAAEIELLRLLWMLLRWHLRVVLRSGMLVAWHTVRCVVHDLRLHLMMWLHLHGRPTTLPRWPLIVPNIH